MIKKKIGHCFMGKIKRVYDENKCKNLDLDRNDFRNIMYLCCVLAK